MSWTAEIPIVWIVDGQRVPGRIAISAPELVPGGDGEAVCEVALDGLQPVTRVRGYGTFHALAQGMRFLDMRIRDHVARGVRAVLPGENDDPDSATESIIAMFRPLEP